jgi:hypothetical protein
MKSNPIKQSVPSIPSMKEVVQVEAGAQAKVKSKERSEGVGCLIRAVFLPRREVGKNGSQVPRGRCR